VNQLSDDPVAAAALVQNHGQAAADGQFSAELEHAAIEVSGGGQYAGNVVQALTRALSLGVEGANGR